MSAQKTIPAFFWALFIVFILCSLPGLLVDKDTIFKEKIVELEQFTQEQKRLLDLHNSRRKSGSLILDKKLCDYAQKHSEYMAGKNSLTHSSMSELQDFCGAETVGENIAWGQETPDAVVSSWMWSPMHRWNILGSSYKKVGFGIKEDSQGRIYWCAVFSN